MKFNVKSAVPVAALTLVSMTTVSKIENAYAEQSIEAPMSIEMGKSIIIDKGNSNDSFGACDSSGAGDSFGAGDSMSANNSLGSCLAEKTEYGVYIIERDFNRDGQIEFGNTIFDTMCVKAHGKTIIAQANTQFAPYKDTIIGTGYKNINGAFVLRLFDDPQVNGKLPSTIRAYQESEEWLGTFTGIWYNNLGQGDVRAQVYWNKNEYIWAGCNFVLGE
ncbi:hypothetical protein OE749_02120 [Aestuariibacter sp. AA17]|uniref:Uncharacterized protein n=1 Tax=Fluctibacter corallii TaxID=2984329 RepID=A0ABT3A498_9ALTE|nr:hypothetical protein [Aestuariibacter sp. AA17]MCV2883493.1 hypothetical protein [Aestuariibacter sp. AA17]